MAMNDVLSDMISRIRNAQAAMQAVVRCPASKLLEAVCKVLQDEGYIKEFKRENIAKGRDELVIELKYHEGRPVIHEIKRVSSSGRRIYGKIKKLPRGHSGMGISILSTSKGVMSDFEARQANVGGEVLCKVF